MLLLLFPWSWEKSKGSQFFRISAGLLVNFPLQFLTAAAWILVVNGVRKHYEFCIHQKNDGNLKNGCAAVPQWIHLPLFCTWKRPKNIASFKLLTKWRQNPRFGARCELKGSGTAPFTTKKLKINPLCSSIYDRIEIQHLEKTGRQKRTLSKLRCFS